MNNHKKKGSHPRAKTAAKPHPQPIDADTAAELLRGEDTAEDSGDLKLALRMMLMPRPNYYDDPQLEDLNAKRGRACNFLHRIKFPHSKGIQPNGPLSQDEERELRELLHEIEATTRREHASK